MDGADGNARASSLNRLLGQRRIAGLAARRQRRGQRLRCGWCWGNQSRRCGNWRRRCDGCRNLQRAGIARLRRAARLALGLRARGRAWGCIRGGGTATRDRRRIFEAGTCKRHRRAVQFLRPRPIAKLVDLVAVREVAREQAYPWFAAHQDGHKIGAQLLQSGLLAHQRLPGGFRALHRFVRFQMSAHHHISSRRAHGAALLGLGLLLALLLVSLRHLRNLRWRPCLLLLLLLRSLLLQGIGRRRRRHDVGGARIGALVGARSHCQHRKSRERRAHESEGTDFFHGSSTCPDSGPVGDFTQLPPPESNARLY